MNLFRVHAESVGGRVDTTQYRLSSAARLFKSHALVAAKVADLEVADTERLYRSGYIPLYSDLIPVG